MTSKRNSDETETTKKPETPKQAVERLSQEILDECKLIAAGLQENCFNLVEKTKALMSAEEKISK